MYLFHRRDGYFLRYDESKNQKKEQSGVGDLSLHLPDDYNYLPSFAELLKRINRPALFDRSGRSLEDLDVITSIATVQTQDALSTVLRVMDKNGLTDQRGYHIFIEAFTLKIFDEKRNEAHSTRKLDFYISQEEADFKALADAPIQKFIARMEAIYEEAAGHYRKILSVNVIDWQDIGHVRVVVAVCRAFQDFSFVRSAATDLYQLVFYNFANEFTRSEAAQFLTPLPVIDFVVKIVNPCNSELVIDPCCGIGDFLSLAFVNARHKDKSLWLKDANIYGIDLDARMIMLATLNMLLNGDGEAKLFQQADKGSILHKVQVGNSEQLATLLPKRHKNGAWDDWPDHTRLQKFDVVLTNPPFGEDRAYRPHNDHDREIIAMYETWDLSGGGDNIDLGIVFLENAYRLLKDEGRFGIVLSNSIASINKWQKVREWLMGKMRIVALFDLPENVFAETGVNTSIIVAYKPKAADLARLTKDGYSIFVRDIHHVGYEKRTSKRNVFFNPVYRIDETTFDVQTDAECRPVLEEDFSAAIADFRQWGMGQEAAVPRLFLQEA